MASVLGGLALYGYLWRHDIAFVTGNQAFLAQALLFSVYFAGFLWVEAVAKGFRRIEPWVWLGFALFALIMLFITAIRGAMLGMVAGIGLGVAWYALRNPRRTIRYGAIGLIVAGLCAITGIFVLKDSPIITAIRPLERLSQLNVADTSVSTRLNAWKTAVRAIQDRPVLGWGPEQYQAAFNTHFNPAFLSSVGESIWFDKAHNIVLDIAVSSGFVGLAAYLWLIVMAFRACWYYYRVQPLHGIIVTCALVSYLIFNLTLFDTMYSLIPFMLLLAGLSVLSNHSEAK
ncbi:MAG TPA: O-antigen ligase family protein, partial [Methylophilaceae bacterium]|nr:O-antigen ligase family protein [Methylophilaceae bacterium]